MAIKKNTNDLISQAATTLADNSTQDISPQDVREMAENNAFSSYNKITDNNLVGLKNYSTAATYEAAQGVVYNGSIYISNTTPTPGAFNASEWDILSGGEINTSSNSGAGEGLALAKSGSNLPFKSITAGTGITLTSAANELQISSAGGTDTNIGNADLTQTDNVRTYTLPSGSSKFLDILGDTDNGLRMLNNSDIILNASTDGTGVNNIRLVSVLNQGRIEFNNNFWKVHAVGSANLFLGSTNGTKGSVTIETGVVVRTPGTVGATSLSGPEIRFYDRALTNQWAKFDINGNFIFGSNSFVASEKFSIQDDTLIKGSDNSANTSGFKVTDVNNNKLLDIRNNGQTAWGGNKVINVAHAFYNSGGGSASLARFYETDGTIGINLKTNGTISTANSSQGTIFSTNASGGVPHIRLFHQTRGEIIDLQSGSSHIDATSLTLGGQIGKPGAKVSIMQASAVVNQQLFFGNITTNTAGRLGSDTGFGTDHKGLECFDTDINKKFVWNGSAWEKIRGNIESVTQATATTLTPNIDTSTMEILSSLAAALTIAAPTGTPHEGQGLTFRFKDDGTARALTWNAIFEDYTGSLPTTTTAGKTVYIGCKYNLINTKWDVVAVQTQP